MSRTIWVGAVAYDPKVVGIWEGMRRYFHEEAHLARRGRAVSELRGAGRRPPRLCPASRCRASTSDGIRTSPIIQADAWSDHRCRPIAMRDTDLGWMTKIVAVTGGPVATLADLKNRTLALGSRDSGHAAILPVYFLEREGLAEGKDYRTLRFNSDVGKHGDTGTSEADVVRAVLDGRADAGAIGSPFWNAVRSRAPGAGRRADARSGPRRPIITACSRRGPISTPRWSRRLPRHCSG